VLNQSALGKKWRAQHFLPNRDFFDMCSDLALTALGARFSSSGSTFVRAPAS
jgi:hypothetical protein